MRLFLGFLVFLMWASIARYYYVCEIKNHCKEPVEEPAGRHPSPIPCLWCSMTPSPCSKDYEEFAFSQASTFSPTFQTTIKYTWIVLLVL